MDIWILIETSATLLDIDMLFHPKKNCSALQLYERMS